MANGKPKLRKRPRSFRRMTKKIRRRIQQVVSESSKEKGVRLTSATVIRDEATGKLLVTYSARSGPISNPGIPKGGIERRETAEQAALRETRQEVGLEGKGLRIVGYGGTGKVSCLRPKNGCNVKRYIIFYAVFRGELKLKINPNEIASAGLFDLDEAAEIFSGLIAHRPSKAKLLFRILEMYARKIGRPEWRAPEIIV